MDPWVIIPLPSVFNYVPLISMNMLVNTMSFLPPIFLGMVTIAPIYLW